MQNSAYFLIGPTAVGKTAVAHHLALRMGADILSADAMAVYRGMDVGTAKPEKSLRAAVRYWGIDIVDPVEDFSVGDYTRYAREVLDRLRRLSRPVIVVGGSGLYVKALIDGLDELPRGDVRYRQLLEGIYFRWGIGALRDLLGRLSSDALVTLADPNNPRRVMRRIEIILSGGVVPSRRKDMDSSSMVVGLLMERNLLWKRIEERAARMFAGEIQEEALRLRKQYGFLSRTAAQAIGYREAFAFLDGLLSGQDALDATIRRTRRLLRRQLTWFRHQLDVSWIQRAPGADINSTAELIQRKWDEYGPVATAF